MEIAAIIISILTLAFSLYIYFVHGKKLNRQNEILNNLEIEKYNQEKEESKKAVIEANVISIGTNKIIKVYNKGKSVAKNLNIFFNDDIKDSILTNPSPIDITSQNSVDVKVTMTKETPDFTQVNFEWEDEHSKANTYTQKIMLR